MPGFPTPIINGINYSWANISLVLFGVPVVGITKISYKEKQEKKNQYGVGHRPVSRGYGNIEIDGSIELYLDEWRRIIAAAPGNRVLAIPPFDITVIYAAAGNITPARDVLRAVEFLEDPFDASQGDNRLLVSVPLVIAQIDRN